MYKLVLVLSVILAHVTLGDMNARFLHRRAGRQQRPHTITRTKASQRNKEEPQRRTFITALLAAEIQYLEGLLADQENSRNPPKKHKPGKTKAKKQHSHKPASSQYQSSSAPQKYVSKLDPFYMIAAPDLTKETKSSNSYEAPTETTTKYGELEHYNLKGYLPPAPSAKKPVASEPLSYDLPQVTPYTTTTTTTPPPPPPSYQTPSAPAYSAPAPAPYEAPAPAPAYAAPEPAYEAPVPAPAYKEPEPTYQQSYSAPSVEPLYTAPASTYPSPQVSYAPAEPTPEVSYAPAAPVVTYATPQPVSSYKTASSNSHPLTFFHDSQAEKVHDGGEWPTVYYNTFDSGKKTLIL